VSQRAAAVESQKQEQCLFSQTTEYALRAMSCLAHKPDQLVPTPELSARTGVPANYLAKVLQNLATAELISGRRGVGGGYRLAKPPSDITILDVVNAVCQIQRVHTCPLSIDAPDLKLCALHRVMDQAAEQLINLFNGVTLEQVVKDASEMQNPLCDSDRLKQLGISVNHKR